MSILVTAFDVYDRWDENSSWTALTEYLREYGVASDIRTRRYPVHLDQMRSRLEADLARGVDGVIHLGQSPGSTTLLLESIAVNVAGNTRLPGEEFGPLVEDGPVAFRSRCPLGLWCQQLRHHRVPAEVSYHAGTYLCNAIMYLTHWYLHRWSLPIPVVFVHLPLLPRQAVADGTAAGVELQTLVEGVRVLVDLMRRSVATTATV